VVVEWVGRICAGIVITSLAVSVILLITAIGYAIGGWVGVPIVFAVITCIGIASAYIGENYGD